MDGDERDDLDEMVAEFTKCDHDFPALVDEARRRRAIDRDTRRGREPLGPRADDPADLDHKGVQPTPRTERGLGKVATGSRPEAAVPRLDRERP